MKIELVLTPSGLVGRRFQDRWNLDQLGITSIPWTRNQAGLKRLRRQYSDFTFSTLKGQTVSITNEERQLFGRPFNNTKVA